MSRISVVRVINGIAIAIFLNLIRVGPASAQVSIQAGPITAFEDTWREVRVFSPGDMVRLRISNDSGVPGDQVRYNLDSDLTLEILQGNSWERLDNPLGLIDDGSVGRTPEGDVIPPPASPSTRLDPGRQAFGAFRIGEGSSWVGIYRVTLRFLPSRAAVSRDPNTPTVAVTYFEVTDPSVAPLPPDDLVARDPAPIVVGPGPPDSRTLIFHNGGADDTATVIQSLTSPGSEHNDPRLDGHGGGIRGIIPVPARPPDRGLTRGVIPVPARPAPVHAPPAPSSRPGYRGLTHSTFRS